MKVFTFASFFILSVASSNLLADQYGHSGGFSGAGGEIKIEIDNDDWYGLNVNPNVTVVINGEIEKGILGTSIELDRIHLK